MKDKKHYQDHCYIKVVQFLCEAGADKDKGDQTGATPLFRAAQNGHLEVVQFLCNAGAKNIADNNGVTPRRIAEENGYLEVVRFLAKHGADKDEAKQYTVDDTEVRIFFLAYWY